MNDPPTWIDLIASADAERYRRALHAVVRDRNVDGLIVLFVSPIMIDAAAVAEAIVAEVRARGSGPHATKKPCGRPDAPWRSSAVASRRSRATFPTRPTAPSWPPRSPSTATSTSS